MPTPEFTVSLADFKALLKQLKLVMKSVKKGDVHLSFDGSRMNITMQGFDTSLKGQGYWPGTARVALRSLLPLAKMPPETDPVTLRFKDDRLSVQSYSMPASWQHISPQSIELPLDAKPNDILRLRFRYSDGQILSSGFMPKLEELEKEAIVKITNAARLLKQYGVTPGDIKRAYEEAMKRGIGDQAGIEHEKGGV